MAWVKRMEHTLIHVETRTEIFSVQNYSLLDCFSKQKIQMSRFIKILRVANHWPSAMSFDVCETNCLNPSFCR